MCSKAVIKYPLRLKHVATVPCEMSVLKNRHAPELIEANCHAKLSHLRQMLENIHPLMLAQFRSLAKKIFTVATKRHACVYTINAQTVTGGISRRVTSGHENTSLIFVDHGIKVIEGCYRNVMLL